MIKFRDRLAYPFVYIKKGQASLTLKNKIKLHIKVEFCFWSVLRDSLGSL